MRIVIVEDEPAAARQLGKMLQRVEGLVIDSLAICRSVAETREELRKGADMVFLDLNLMGESGFDILTEFMAEPFETIITTAYPEHALTAFEYGARDYLVKPFSQERLSQAVSRIARADKAPSLNTIMVKEREAILPVAVDNIDFIRSAGDYSELYLKDGGKKLCGKRMDFLEKRLPGDFVRVHRTAIIRVSTALALKVEPGGKYAVEIQGCEEPIPVGRKYFKELKNRLGGEG